MQPFRTDRSSGLTPDRENPYAGFGPDWWRHNGQRARAAIRALWWTFVPHEHNSPIPKVVTTILMLTWAIITLGIAFGFAEAGDFYPYMTALVFAIVGAIWGFELDTLDKFAQLSQSRNQRNVMRRLEEEQRSTRSELEDEQHSTRQSLRDEQQHERDDERDDE